MELQSFDFIRIIRPDSYIIRIMAFVDEITISASAGRGGDGVVRWLHEKFREFGGPSGGDGGRGGNVRVKAVRDIAALARYKFEKKFHAENGGAGGNKEMHGKNGDDLVLVVPVGSVVTNRETGESFDLATDGQDVIILKGGHGGKGNAHFKGSTNQYPTEFTKGTIEETAELYIELKLIVDAGFIGLPNAGKSSLLNALTNAGVKVGDYPFTTLDPNLGAFKGFILADIPGLIEGASAGKGLGHKFLRHIARTKVLIHCVSSEHEDPLAVYQTVRTELVAHDPALLEKPELVFLTKADVVSENELEKKLAVLKKKKITATAVSILDDASVKQAAGAIARALGMK
ncbi:MAG TPA: GTPase ObgE [Candidatus Paceibacterota bacterium]